MEHTPHTTKKEREARRKRVLALYAEGWTQTQIAQELGIRRETVNNDVKKLREQSEPTDASWIGMLIREKVLKQNPTAKEILAAAKLLYEIGRDQSPDTGDLDGWDQEFDNGFDRTASTKGT